MADYRCGCTNIQPTKQELLEYCGKHGEPRRMCIKLPEAARCGRVG
ncbi:MAG: hypothetical protein KAS32_23295 [Candidatus Peribacteraceae bacterium]|nr:hypothetical protein [Candidatus Peribacteraceae bacterium]